MVSGASATPLMNRMPKAVQLSTMAVPMSGCLMMRAAETTSTPMTGAMTCLAGARPVGAPDHDVGGEDHEGQLHELGGLEAEQPEPDPARRAAGRHAEAGHQHGDQQAEGHDHQGDAELAPLAVVDPGEDQQGADPDHHPQGLADEDRPRRPVGDQRDHRRGRAHHHQADDAEQGDEHAEGRGRRARRPASGPARAPAGAGCVGPCPSLADAQSRWWNLCPDGRRFRGGADAGRMPGPSTRARHGRACPGVRVTGAGGGHQTLPTDRKSP